MISASEFLWGVDLGGTKIECVVLESATNPAVIERRRVATNGARGYHSVLKSIADLIIGIAKDIGASPAQLGIGTPGSLDPVTQLLRGSNSQQLQNQPIHRDLETLLGVPVTIENDANCFTLAETRMGAVTELAGDPQSVFGVILGTGVGGGLIINNQLIHGRNLIAGEWGHNYLDASGGSCYCGKTGCVETVISGPALEKFYQEKSGKQASLAEIHGYSTAGDINAMLTMERLIHFFALGISSIVNSIDPDVIVVGGGVGNIDRLYSDGATEIAKHAFAPSISTSIVKPILGDSAGVFGAAYLCHLEKGLIA